jgi:manganese transport protein
VTGVITYAILAVGGGYRPVELIIGGLIAAIGASYLLEMVIVPPNWAQALHGAFVPYLPDHAAVILAVGIVGATVMPHAIYLHSGLTQARAPAQNDAERRALLRYSNREVLVALTAAGLVNAAMVAMAASAFHAGHRDVAQIETAYHTLVPLLGGAAAVIFLISLMAAGISSSVVGTMAGQVIMQGFTTWRIPILGRRLVTMLPAFVVVAAGFDATRCLVISQVVLSLVLPVPMVALLVLSGNRQVMGAFVTGPRLMVVAAVATALTLVLNGVLLVQIVE